jgi:hypothetical protein
MSGAGNLIVDPIAVGVAVANDIVSDTALYTLVNLYDFVEVQRQGTLWSVSSSVIVI